MQGVIGPGDDQGLQRSYIPISPGISEIEPEGQLSFLSAQPISASNDISAYPRIIYVHGTPGDATMFRRYLENLIPGHEAIAVDRPGFGQSVPLSAVTSYEKQAQALLPLLVEQDGKKPILVGHSLGGPIIAQMAAMAPERVGGLVILAGALDPALEKPRWYNHVAGFPISRIFTPVYLRHSNDEILQAPAEARKLQVLLDRVSCPVVIVHGTKDGLVPYENVAFMRIAFTSASSIDVLELSGAGHLIVWKNEQTVREAILRAIERRDALRR